MERSSTQERTSSRKRTSSRIAMEVQESKVPRKSEKQSTKPRTDQEGDDELDKEMLNFGRELLEEKNVEMLENDKMLKDLEEQMQKEEEDPLDAFLDAPFEEPRTKDPLDKPFDEPGAAPAPGAQPPLPPPQITREQADESLWRIANSLDSGVQFKKPKN